MKIEIKKRDPGEVIVTETVMASTYNPPRGAVVRSVRKGEDLSGANLKDVDWGDVGIPVVDNIHQKVYEAASRPGALDMGAWHRRGGVYCRAEWAIDATGETGWKLEEEYGPSVTACMIYSKSDPEMTWMPDFDCSDAEALTDMKSAAAWEKYDNGGITVLL